ncbi:hypothetical protein [Vibrio splendidus]|uniref:hypothetical protein n=1 Tax=Vibrio splendidus TaxID=29497 RepID=UPI00352F8952
MTSLSRVQLSVYLTECKTRSNRAGELIVFGFTVLGKRSPMAKGLACKGEVLI